MKTIYGTYDKKVQILSYEINEIEFEVQGEFDVRTTDNGYDVLHWHDDDTLVVASVVC